MRIPAHLLVVGHDATSLDTLSRQLALAGYRVSTAGSGARALATLEEVSYDLMLLDLDLRDLEAFDRSTDCDTATVITSACSRAERHSTARTARPFASPARSPTSPSRASSIH